MEIDVNEGVARSIRTLFGSCNASGMEDLSCCAQKDYMLLEPIVGRRVTGINVNA